MAIHKAARSSARVRPSCRRFTLADAMVLIAALGLGLAWGRSEIGLFLHHPRYPRDAPFSRSDLSRVMSFCFSMLGTFLLVGLPAYLMIRLRRPRPASRRLLRQPGMISACAVILKILLVVVSSLIGLLPDVMATEFSELQLTSLYDSFASRMNGTYNAGYVVAGAWLTLGLCRLWRAEPGWIDLMGRVLGIAWIVMIWRISMDTIAWCVTDFILRHTS